MNVQTVSDAWIGGSANIHAGSGAGGDVLVEATHNSEVHGLGFSGAAGLIGIEGQVVVVNDTSSQTAHVDGQVSQANGTNGLKVVADAVRDESVLSIGVGIGLVAGGASIAILNVHGDTQALIGGVAISDD